jgi:rubredoxin
VNPRAILAKVTSMATTGARRSLHAVHRAIWEHEPVRQVCPECQVDFAPSLTAQRCPVCGWQAPEATSRRRPPAPARGVREAAGLGLAWFVGALAFALLAHALYG